MKVADLKIKVGDRGLYRLIIAGKEVTTIFLEQGESIEVSAVEADGKARKSYEVRWVEV